MRKTRFGFRCCVLLSAAYAIESAAGGDARGDTPPTSATGEASDVPDAAAPVEPVSPPSAPPLVAPVPPPPVPASPPPPPPVVEEASPITGQLYGFIETRFNATTAEPDGNTNTDGSPQRYAPVKGDISIPTFNIMAQGNLYSRFHYYFNLSAPGAETPTVDIATMVRNAWLEVSILGDYLNLRIGKLYRRLGMYNEIIDTVPSFIGIETPTFISGNRPMLTRTTNAMLHGRASSGAATVSYAATIGQDETSPGDDVWSPGFDLNVDWDSAVRIGTSYYTTGGTVIPSTAPGDGDPVGGVAPWMAQDSFQVYGGYGEVDLGSFLLHAEAWVSPHQATRDPARVAIVEQNAANFSAANRARFAGGANYTYSTFDIRAAYTLEFGGGDNPVILIPYADFDYVRSLESISDPAYGGDGQPGESPRGLNMHARVGAVFKPVPVVAFKLELTHAMYDYGFTLASDEEFWTSLSYQWDLFRK